MKRLAVVGNVYIALVAATMLACSDGSSFRSPTAPAAPPAAPASGPFAPVVGWSGSFTVLDAGPAGDCVADAFTRDGARSAPLELELPQASKGASGRFEIFGNSICSFQVLESGQGSLQLGVEPWCGWENDAWSYREACGSVPADSMQYSTFVLPDPGTRGVLRGEGRIVLDRGFAVSGNLPNVTLTVFFDLRQ